MAVSEELSPPGLLKRYFGYDKFRPGQEAVIQALTDYQAALAVFPTGGGKSLCYQLPALAYEGVTLVVSPLIALMKDQIDFLQERGIAAARLDSSLSAQEALAVSDQVKSGALKLLYVAPERFNNERFLSLLRQTRIALFAVDEAHCISEWGHNFRPDYLKLAEIAGTLQAERVLALTATATPAVVKDICDAFAIPASAAIVTGFYRPNLKLATTAVSAAERDALLLKRLNSRPPGPTIIYVTLQKTAERLATTLEQAGLAARPYHAGLETEVRSNVQEWWMAGDNRIVVATIAFGMGIDKANVRYVYHYNLPKSLESYSQEIGRAGRDGISSTVELFACPDDLPTLENFVYGDTPTLSSLQSLMRELLARDPAVQDPLTQSGEFDLDMYAVANRHDLRQLVLRTALTYLELRGVLRQGTPRYTGYALKPLLPIDEIVAQFRNEPAHLVANLFSHASKGKTKNAVWYRLNPDVLAEQLDQERSRIVRALEVLEQRGLVELTASDVRQCYTRLEPDADPDLLAAELAQRFHRREEQEIRRLEDVLSLITLNACQINQLVGYFGEKREQPCGHCSFCVTGRPKKLPVQQQATDYTLSDIEALRSLRQANPEALGESRQVARFLCGLTSPALTRARLSKSPLFGIWESRRFKDVLVWCEYVTHHTQAGI